MLPRCWFPDPPSTALRSFLPLKPTREYSAEPTSGRHLWANHLIKQGKLRTQRVSGPCPDKAGAPPCKEIPNPPPAPALRSLSLMRTSHAVPRVWHLSSYPLQEPGCTYAVPTAGRAPPRLLFCRLGSAGSPCLSPPPIRSSPGALRSWARSSAAASPVPKRRRGPVLGACSTRAGGARLPLPPLPNPASPLRGSARSRAGAYHHGPAAAAIFVVAPRKARWVLKAAAAAGRRTPAEPRIESGGGDASRRGREGTGRSRCEPQADRHGGRRGGRAGGCAQPAGSRSAPWRGGAAPSRLPRPSGGGSCAAGSRRAPGGLQAGAALEPRWPATPAARRSPARPQPAWAGRRSWPAGRATQLRRYPDL